MRAARRLPQLGFHAAPPRENEIIIPHDRGLPSGGNKPPGRWNAEKNQKKLETLDSKGEYSTRIYTRISGYVILKISDERVEAEFYTGEEKPSLREILVATPCAQETTP